MEHESVQSSLIDIRTEELQTIEERWQEIVERLNQAMSFPTQIDKHFQSLKEQSNPLTHPGFVFFESLDDFKMAFEILKEIFGLTDELIKKLIEHEQEHIDEAKKLYQQNATYGYGIHFLQTTYQSLGFAPMYIVIPYAQLDSLTAMKNSRQIAHAPTELSLGDKIVGSE